MCAEATLTSWAIRPGETAELAVRADLHDMSGKVKVGVLLASNDPHQPLLKFVLAGTVLKVLVVDPWPIDFGKVPMGSEPELVCSLRPSDGERRPLCVRTVSLPTEMFSLVSEDTMDPRGGARLRIRLRDGLPRGRFATRCVVDTNLTEPITIPLVGTIVGDLDVFPTKLTLSRDVTPVPDQYVQIAPGRIREFSILSVTLPLERMTYRLIDVAERGYLLRLSCSSSPDDLRGKAVIVHTTAPDMSEIILPFEVLP